MRTAIIGILSLFIFLILNTGLLSYQWMKAIYSNVNPYLYALLFGLFVIFTLVLFVLSRKPEIQIPRILLQLSHYSLGVVVYAMLIIHVTGLLLIILKIIGLQNLSLLYKYAFYVSTILIITLSTYGILQAKSIHVTRYSVDTDKNKPLKIALISDLHIGYIVEEDYLEKVVSVIHQMNPDIVCIAGDIFDGDMTAVVQKEAIKDIFLSIQAPYGVYACLGNHDAGDTYLQMLSFLKEAGINVLLDESVIIEDRVVLIGRRDSSPIGNHDNKRKESFTIPSSTLPVVVLDHQPSNIDEYDENVDLVLCGHTHRGQIFPGNIITDMMYDVDYGHRVSEDLPDVIVTSGIGTWGPVLRIGSYSEVVEILLN